MTLNEPELNCHATSDNRLNFIGLSGLCGTLISTALGGLPTGGGSLAKVWRVLGRNHYAGPSLG